MAVEPAPAEVQAPAAASGAYAVYTQDDTLSAPYAIKGAYLRGIKEGVDVLPDTPLLVFINAKSGGRSGPELALALTRAVGRAQVYDLSEHRPDKVLTKLWENLKEAEASGDKQARVYRERLRVLVAGGDGTIAWVMGVIKTLGLRPPPPVAIMPLGTGNDLARTFGWGHTFSSHWIKGYNGVYSSLMRITTARIDDLDCWRVRIKIPRKDLVNTLPHSLHLTSPSTPSRAGTNSQAPTSPTEGPTTAQGMFWNYFSVGLDAKAAYGFHSVRENYPALARGRISNQLWYSVCACTSGWFCCTKPLSAKVKLSVLLAGSDTYQEIEIPSTVKALVVVNLQSYAGGRNLWGAGPSKEQKAGARSGRKIKEPTFNDGLIEVVGLRTGYHTASIMATGGTPVNATRLCQASGVKLELRASYSRPDGTPSHCYMQVDGEPWIQDVPSGKDAAPITVEITHCGVSKVCHNIQGLPNPLREMLGPSIRNRLAAGSGVVSGATRGRFTELAGPGLGEPGGSGGGVGGRMKPPSPMSPSMMHDMQSGVSVSGVTAADSDAAHLGSAHSTTLSLVSRATTARRCVEDD